MKNISILHTIILAMLFTTAVNAQDQIVTTSGSTIKGRVSNIKNNEVVYWKHLIQRKTISTKDVLYVQYDNGTKTVLNNISMAKDYKNYSSLAKNSNQAAKPDTAKGASVNLPANFHVYYIERLGSNFRLDSNQIVSTGKINDIVSQAPSPMVLAQLKLAKTMRTLNTLATIASFPGSASGGFASYVTIKNMASELKAGPAPFKSYLASGMSFVATLALPITSAILKSAKDKLYDRTLTMYSAMK